MATIDYIHLPRRFRVVLRYQVILQHSRNVRIAASSRILYPVVRHQCGFADGAISLRRIHTVSMPFISDNLLSLWVIRWYIHYALLKRNEVYIYS